MLKSANITWDQESNREIDTVKRICDICVKYKKPKLRPAVGFSLLKDFNDAVVVDLKEIDKTYILHLIDHAKGYSAAAVAKSKKKEDIAEAVIKYWIAIGAPRVILSDNGVEFYSVKFVNSLILLWNPQQQRHQEGLMVSLNNKMLYL